LVLLASVEELLAAHESTDCMLDRILVDGHPIEQSLAFSVGLPTPDVASADVGSLVGSFRLMERIGEGGFGLVFVAQQERPVKRKVALKIIKPGTGSNEVVARFELERQALAMMDHPNIARVFDAGVTDDGRPYFVMELVRGLPITEYCDNYRLNLEDRVRLFQDVCAAVQHAHQKGVIHRDLKPSNVMVTLHDDRAIVKVIDFGVAKAMGDDLTERTIYTRFYSMIGTPLYMSPEQAQMSGLDVDTRSDIYSLGVMLYELLVGTTPFERERLSSAGFDEMRQIIREEEPPLPSHRVSTLGNRLTTIADARHTQPSRLEFAIRGDLDWIVMKALEKDRNRRYESASALAGDLRRFLDQQPIDARPPSAVYKLTKFTRRHRKRETSHGSEARS
ncbi:MAG: serine/threonine protein kinase, partial [Planctomycetaceae bacterium]|nr:serine/threonine protein kinase [Planctomycetaceae bacterium]